jgi:integrase
MVRLAAVTLMRQGELRGLRRDMVDLAQGVIFLPETKTGPRPVALGMEAAGLLRAQLARHGGPLVFPSPAGRPYSRVHISRIWRRAIRGAGRRDFSFHDLRHHAAMRALADGASFPELQGLGGWKTPGMVNRYASVTADRVRELQDRINAAPRRALDRRS